MEAKTIRSMLDAQWGAGKFLCVGIDPDFEQIPERHRFGHSRKYTMVDFCKSVVNETHDLACAFKPNIAFFSGHGPWGVDVLQEVVAHIRNTAPFVPVILDGKRADIGNTNRGYAWEAQYFNAHAMTANPYLGEEALAPFFDTDLGIVVLCKTSNPGSGEFQDRQVMPTAEEAERWGIVPQPMPLYELVAYRVSRSWVHRDQCMLVVGATYPDQLARVRAIVGEMPILAPGIGKQKGDLAATINAGISASGRGLLINSSSGIIFADDPRAAAMKLDRDIRSLISTRN